MLVVQDLSVAVAVFAGGLVSGFAGFAFAAPAGAVMAFVFPPAVTIPHLFACGLCNQAFSLWSLRRSLRLSDSAPYVVGGLVGLPLGLLLMSFIDPFTYRRGFGLFLVTYVVVTFAKPMSLYVQSRKSVLIPSLVGAAGGVVGGFTAMPGAVPAVWLDMKGYAKERKRTTLQPFIFSMQVLALPLLAQRGILLLSPELLIVSLPALFVGTWAGLRLYGHVDERIFRNGTLALLLVSGLMLLR